VAVEVTFGTGMSCISSASRGEDNGRDNEDNLDDGQQGQTPPRLSLPRRNRAIQGSKAKSCVLIKINAWHLKGYYGVTVGGLSQASRLFVIITLPGNARRRDYYSAGT
jgi:hypothetical protein